MDNGVTKLVVAYIMRLMYTIEIFDCPLNEAVETTTFYITSAPNCATYKSVAFTHLKL